MFLTYLRRELLNRRRQTVIVALGLAIGIALVSVVSAVSGGVKDSQDKVLESLYGVGTDITVTQQAAPGTDRPRFDIGAGDGASSGGTRTFSRTSLATQRGATTFDDATIEKIKAADGVGAVATALKLTNRTFEGQLPDFAQGGDRGFAPGGQTQGGQTPSMNQGTVDPNSPTTTISFSGGSDGRGGAAFSVNEFSVMGITSGKAEVGPVASVELSKGRLLSAADNGKKVAVIDSAYATTESLKVGGTITVADKEFSIVGIVAPAAGATETASNVYIPIDVARDLANIDSGVTNVYVKATDGSTVAAAQAALEKILPDATVSTSADLAETVSGSLSTAGDLITNFGRWLSVIVIIVAFVLAMLFTMGGVARRTREFGTLKALGWRSNRIVRQVMAESIVQGLIGGVVGAAIAFGGVAVVNAVAPTLQASTGGFAGLAQTNAGIGQFGPPGGFGGDGGPRPFGGRGATTIDVVLNAHITPSILAAAVGLAVLGGVLAGAAGGMRASRLHPAESLRSVA